MRYRTTVALFALLAGALVLSAGCSGKKKAKYPICGKDKDCKDGEHCVNKRCLQCGEDSHCADGKKCVEGACVKVECTKDDECSDGQVCKAGKCTSCQSNSECGPGGKCNSGKCDRPKKCTKNEDCEDDEDCIDGTCQRPWKKEKPTGLNCTLEVIYFALDSDAISPDMRDRLNKNGECIKKAPKDRGVYLVGHTDPRGTEEYNIALSERRARSVGDYLARLGIDPARFRFTPKGESEASGTDETGWSKDRRVEFEWR
jgi:peptidoglycan-associated lipoprotein